MALSSISRRGLIASGLCVCCYPPLGRANQFSALTEVGDGIFIRTGVHEEATVSNNDAIANIGFIVGRESVLVTDSGGSYADGQWLRSEILRRTDKPIRSVLLSHVHPDHCFGAAAFEPDRPDFIGHHRLAAALAVRGTYYLERLVQVLGADKAGKVVYPTRDVQDTIEIDLGGRRVRIQAHDTAHTSSDLSMLDSQTGILFPADLLFVKRVPSLDGSLLGWLKQIDRLSAFKADRAVPSHGPAIVDCAPALADLTRYLSNLRDGTRKAIADGKTIEEAIGFVAEGERDRWTLFADYNGHNVTQAYKELEWE